MVRVRGLLMVMDSGDLVRVHTPTHAKDWQGGRYTYIEAGYIALVIRVRGGGMSDIYINNCLVTILTNRLYIF